MYKNVEKPLLCGDYSSSLYYRDYRYLSDDVTVLKNPHKGWYWHFIDNGCKRVEYRDGIGDDRMTDFPGLNHLYLRIDWADIEKQEGIYDWSYIDEIFKTWSHFDYTFSFRLCTYEGGSIKFATPEWVKDCGANGWFCADGSWQPDFGDSIYLEKLDRFMQEYGRKYNGHPLVEFIDVGTFGIWGEGHPGIADENKSSLETVIKHIDMHLKYFPDTYILVNDDMINALDTTDGKVRKYLMEYCVGKGLGLRDDSVLYSGYADCGYYGYDTMRTPFMYDEFYEFAPVDLELEHYHHYSAAPSRFKAGYTVYEALQRSHATFCGFHGYPRDLLEKFPYFADRIANKLGYWYFVNGAVIPECVSGLPTVIKVWFENKGFCHAYYPYTLKFKLVNEENGNEIIVSEQLGTNLKWKFESVTMERIKLDLRAAIPGKYTLCVGMFDGKRPIRLGFKTDCKRNDGFYDFDTISVN
ncbi:MAG: DUF4832 domain-containing protein [Bacteroidaceae bacterium]|nr:DUF4832 domain-containing protein [Bacteroidaceae bacterium]